MENHAWPCLHRFLKRLISLQTSPATYFLISVPALGELAVVLKGSRQLTYCYRARLLQRAGLLMFLHVALHCQGLSVQKRTRNTHLSHYFPCFADLCCVSSHLGPCHSKVSTVGKQADPGARITRIQSSVLPPQP